MQTPLEIEFQGIHARSGFDRETRLEQRYGRVTACRVVLKAGPASVRSTRSPRACRPALCFR
jgi:hypothetical protein